MGADKRVDAEPSYFLILLVNYHFQKDPSIISTQATVSMC